MASDLQGLQRHQLVRLTPEGWEKFVELGSNKWMAEAVERDHKKRLNAGKS